MWIVAGLAGLLIVVAGATISWNSANGRARWRVVYDNGYWVHYGSFTFTYIARQINCEAQPTYKLKDNTGSRTYIESGSFRCNEDEWSRDFLYPYTYVTLREHDPWNNTDTLWQSKWSCKGEANKTGWITCTHELIDVTALGLGVIEGGE
jgi:hypothetical protein